MANIFKTTLKKDVIADIENNNIREIRFPITKFWASRFTTDYNLDDKVFNFKAYDSLEVSSPSNKETISETYTFDFVRTFVDGDEFVVEFKDIDSGDDEITDDVNSSINEHQPELNDIITQEYTDPDVVADMGDSEIEDIEAEYISNEDIFDTIKDWFDDENIFEPIFESDSVFAINGRQIIIRPKGRVLGFKKTLPLNNDNDVRVEFDKQIKIYFDTNSEFDNLDIFENFKNQILENFTEILKNNFLFVWKRYTGIFMEDDGRIYFGMRYATRKVIGFDRKYNVQ